jgi:antitoxin YefM
VSIVPFTEARNRLSELVDEVGRTHMRVEITRHGFPVAVLISPHDLEALEETIDVLSSPEAMRQLADSRRAVRSGDVLDADDLEQLMAKRRRSGTRR